MLLRLVFLALLCVAVAGVPLSQLARNSGQCSGTCLDINTNSCSNGFQRGLCPGAANIQCCPNNPPAAPPAIPDTHEQSAAQSLCVSAGGKCMDSRGNSCATGFKTGMCAGGASVKCCLSGLSFNTLEQCYPQGEAEEVKKRIGGNVDAAWITNTCAIRMSHTLNCAGKRLGPVTGQSITGRAPSKWNYVFRVKQLSPIVKALFGNGVTLEGRNGRGVDRTPILGKKGIIYFDTTGVWTDATGHFDLWNGKSMVETSHKDSETNNRYFSIAKSVTFWEFQP